MKTKINFVIEINNYQSVFRWSLDGLEGFLED